jgi:1-acyl-sn-glycerol-3-phosphate acyltransferase
MPVTIDEKVKAPDGRCAMLTFLPGPVRGALSLSLFALNTIFWTLPLLLLHLVKLVVPAKGWRRFWSGFQNRIGTIWISFNNWNLGVTNPVHWDLRGLDGLARDRWYLVVANHQSWVDILVLQRAFNRKIPFLKFFLKRELFWVPFLGLAWWALDYPFLKRSATASKDMETIVKASEKFKTTPVSVMNFVEGTRFTPEKQERQRSPFTHLLKPKAGGLAFILDAMRKEFSSILDVTIAYPQGAPDFWGFLCGRASEIRVHVEVIPVDEEMIGDFSSDKQFRRGFFTWLTQLWARKDERMAALLGEGSEGKS